MRDLSLDALVRANRAAQTPGPEARERNRARLAQSLAAASAGAVIGGAQRTAAAATEAAAHGAGASAATTTSALAKWIAVSMFVVVGSAAGAYVAYIMRRDTRATSPAPVTTSQPSAEALSPPAPPSETATSSAPVAATIDVPSAPPPAPSASGHAKEPRLEARSLERELHLLRSARRAIDAGSPAAALVLLDKYAVEFPHGILKQECQATRVLALCAAGRVASAKHAKDQFLKQEPGSPLADRVRATCANGAH